MECRAFGGPLHGQMVEVGERQTTVLALEVPEPNWLPVSAEVKPSADTTVRTVEYQRRRFGWERHEIDGYVLLAPHYSPRWVEQEAAIVEALCSFPNPPERLFASR